MFEKLKSTFFVVAGIVGMARDAIVAVHELFVALIEAAPVAALWLWIASLVLTTFLMWG